MKNFYLLLLLVFLLPSCSKNVTQFHHEAYFLDLRPLTNDGFFITESNSVGFDYQPIGTMTLYEFSGEDKSYIVSQEDIKKEYKDDLYIEAAIKTRSKKWRRADGYSALSELVKKAKEVGGNGIINLTVKYHYYPSEHSSFSYLIAAEVSGMIIKR